MSDASRNVVFVSVEPYDASRNRKCTFEIDERRQEVARLGSFMESDVGETDQRVQMDEAA